MTKKRPLGHLNQLVKTLDSFGPILGLNNLVNVSKSRLFGCPRPYFGETMVSFGEPNLAQGLLGSSKCCFLDPGTFRPSVQRSLLRPSLAHLLDGILESLNSKPSVDRRTGFDDSKVPFGEPKCAEHASIHFPESYLQRGVVPSVDRALPVGAPRTIHWQSNLPLVSLGEPRTSR